MKALCRFASLRTRCIQHTSLKNVHVHSPQLETFAHPSLFRVFFPPSCVSFLQRKDLPRPSIASSTLETWPQNPTTLSVLLLLLYMDINLGLSAPSQVVSIVASSSSSCFPTKADLMTSTLCRHSHNTKPVYHSLAENRISAFFSPSLYVCVCVFRLFCLKAKFIVKVATAAAHQQHQRQRQRLQKLLSSDKRVENFWN